jgi:hypothetical protein
MREHAPACGEFDERLGADRQSLVIATEATPARDPGKAALHHPSSGHKQKAWLGEDGCWIGLHHRPIQRRSKTTHHLNVTPYMLFCPFNQLSPIMTISPDPRKPRKALLKRRKHRLAACEIGKTGSGDLDVHEIALGIDYHVSFAPPDFFSPCQSLSQDHEPRSF